VYLVGFTIEIYYDARPCERQIYDNQSYVDISIFALSNSRINIMKLGTLHVEQFVKKKNSASVNKTFMFIPL